MRIEIDISAANDPEAHRWLDRILYRIEDGWHVWDTTGRTVPDEIEASAWILDRGRQGKRVREMLVASTQRSAWTLAPHGRRLRVTTRPIERGEFEPDGVDALEPEDAVRLADEPLVILVENRSSDGAFVRRIVTELCKSLDKLWKRPGEPIRFDSVGGAGQMAEEVERRMQGKRHRPRLVAVSDSDRKGPDDSESGAARKLHRACDDRGVPCWILAKREAENYLPRTLLAERPDAGPDHHRQVETWDELDEDQKDFFDMKKGLPDDLSETEEKLFGTLTPGRREILSRGFGPTVYECWNLWNVQVKADLLRRGQGDLERGIDLIRGEV